MDAPPLPDDPRDWPTDPFALLGVPRNVSEGDLKRAYTRLIKKYKPEHKPDEFRRIREAYETAIEMSRWFRDAPPVQQTFADLPFPAPAPAQAREERADPDAPARDHETQIDAPVPPAPRDAVEVAWADAVAGAWEDAYAALFALAGAHPTRADLPLRLYWLLALRPALDADRTRHEWLAAALAASRLSGPALELYRRELAADAQTALYGPYLNLLDQPGASGAAVLAFATARLTSAADDGRWALLELDLAALAHRAIDFDDGSWLAYLTDLAARAAASRAPVQQQATDLLAGLRHLELSHGWAFDQLEHRQAVTVHLARARIPEPVRRFLTVADRGDDARALSDLSAWAAADPEAALRAYDAAMTVTDSRGLMTAMGEILAARRGRPEPYPSALVRGVVRAQVARMPADYERARGALLRFLLAERIDPEELVSACFVDPDRTVGALVQHVRNDESLALVYRTATAAD